MKMTKYAGNLPATITQDHPHERVSNKYTFISTHKVANIIRRNGWRISKYRVNPRSARDGFQRHAIEFLPSSNNKRMAIGEITPRILLTNSHDATTGLRLESGFFRLVCDNGLICPTGQNEDIMLRHVGNIKHNTLQLLEQITTRLFHSLKNIKVYKSITLTDNQVLLYAKAAIEIRKKYYDSELVPESLLTVHRDEDNNSNLWTVFNRIQENITNGGAKQLLNRKGIVNATRKIQPIGNIKIDVSINKELWSIMDRFAYGEPRRISQLISSKN